MRRQPTSDVPVGRSRWKRAVVDRLTDTFSVVWVLGHPFAVSPEFRAEQGPWSRRRDARTTTKAGLRRPSRAGPSVAPPRSHPGVTTASHRERALDRRHAIAIVAEQSCGARSSGRSCRRQLDRELRDGAPSKDGMSSSDLAAAAGAGGRLSGRGPDADARAKAGCMLFGRRRRPRQGPGKVDRFGIVIAEHEPQQRRPLHVRCDLLAATRHRLGRCPFAETHRCVAASACTAGTSSGVGSSSQLSANAIVTPWGWRRATYARIAHRDAQVADRLDAAGEEASLDSQAVADLAAHVGRRGEGQHLSQRLAVAEQPAVEQRIQEAGEVVDGGDERTAAGGAGTSTGRRRSGRPSFRRARRTRAREGRHRPVPGGGQRGARQAQRADHPS